MRCFWLVLLVQWSLVTGVAFSQSNVADSCVRIPMFYASYAFQLPGGDLADRFGANSNIGGGFLYKTGENLLLGADFNYFFSGNLKSQDELMANLYTNDGYIIGQGGSYANLAMFERGFYTGAKAGVVIPVFKSNPNSGLVGLLSAGFLRHKIRIEVADNAAPQLLGDYKRGYDRLTGGFFVGEYIGYMHLSNTRLLNFSAGLEFVQAFTKPFRDVNFDTGQPDPKQNRTDLLFGVRASWFIPIFRRMPEKFYYY